MLAACCLVAQLVVAPRIERVRVAIGGPIDALDPRESTALAFGRLHGASVACLGVGGLAALVTLALLVRLTSRSLP